MQEVDDPCFSSSEEEEEEEMTAKQQEDPQNDIASDISDEEIDNAEQDQ